MDWLALITTIIGAITGGGLMFLLNPKAAKERPSLDNKQIAATTESTAIATMRDAIEEIRKSNDHFQEIDEQKEAEIEKLRDEVINLQKDLSLATTYICGNCGCSCRMPPSRGSGEKWIQQLKNGEVTPNYDPIKCVVMNIDRDIDNEGENKS